MRNLDDVLAIRDLIERWVVYRDSLIWDKFREVWHPEGVMTATWSQGPFEEFIARTEVGVKNGLNILHILGGSAIEVNGNRAVSMTKVLISQRAELDGVMCDVNCHAKHYDLWEKRGGRWGLVYRGTIAEKDRADPVKSGETVTLDRSILEQFPVEYRHLAYLQTKIGYTVDKDCPRMSGGKTLEALYQKGADWLAGRLERRETTGFHKKA